MVSFRAFLDIAIIYRLAACFTRILKPQSMSSLAIKL